MQVRGAMGGDDALGSTRRARGVAEPAGGALVDHRLRVDLGLTGDQVLVADGAGHEIAGGVVEDDHVPESGDRGGHFRDHRQEVRIDQHDPVVGVVHDERQLVDAEPDVEGVQHATAAGHAEVRLDVPVAVPGQSRHAFARGHAERVERTHELVRTGREIGVGVAVGLAGGEPAHHLGAMVMAAGVVEQQPGTERHVHHRRPVEIRHGRSFQVRSPGRDGGGCRGGAVWAEARPSARRSSASSPPTTTRCSSLPSGTRPRRRRGCPRW